MTTPEYSQVLSAMYNILDFWPLIDNSYLTLLGGLWGVYEYRKENRPCYNSTTMYMPAETTYMKYVVRLLMS